MSKAQTGFIGLAAGMNDGIDPSLLEDSSYARGLNITNRGGLVKTRPSFIKVTDETVSIQGQHLIYHF